MVDRAKGATTAHYSNVIPATALAALIAYVEKGEAPGGFLDSVLKNNLLGAVMRANPPSLAAIKEILWVLHNEAPSPCWGSPREVDAWLAMDAAERTKLVDGNVVWLEFKDRIKEEGA